MADQLTDDALLRRLSTDEDRVPRTIVDEIVRRPHLLPRLAALIDDAGLWTRHDASNWAPVHATFIVAAMKTPGALDALLRALDRCAENEETILMEVADSMLSSFGPDAIPALLAGFEHAASYPRIWINDALARIGEKHPAARETVRTQLRDAALKHKDKEVALCAAQNFVAFAKPEDRETLEILVDRNLLDDEDVEDVMAGDADLSVPPALDWLKFYDPEAIEARRREPVGDDEDEEEEVDPGLLPDTASLDVLSRLDAPGAAPAPIVNESAKIGRNDPCPCGSGKKYKKCCSD